MRSTFASTMLEVGTEDPALVVLVGDISHFALQPFAQACPGRFYNVGILEPTIVSMAAGLCIAGLRPVAHTIAPFLIERSLEQIKLDFCYQNLGGSLVSVGAAFDYAGLGCSHHCYDDLAVIKGLPNTEVVYPAMPGEFRTLFRETYRNDRLTYFRLPAAKHGLELPEGEIRMGKGVVVREGGDLTILAAGPQLKTALDCALVLSGTSVEAEVLYLPSLKPFDGALVAESVRKTGHLMVIEEHSMYGGFGDEALRATREVPAVRYVSLAIPDSFQRGYGSHGDHLSSLGLNPEGAAASANALLGKRTTA